jgi:hypothetical protein
MTYWSICNVNQAGAAGNGTETAVPVVYIMLTDVGTGPKFTDQWFYADNSAKDELLAVALSAISTGKQVNATYDAPTNPGGEPYPQLYRLYLQG